MFDWPWSFNMTLSKILLVSAFMLLGACGDDLSGLPDPTTKAAGKEPDSFSFATATELNLTSSSYGSAIVSSVPAGATRYYQFTLGQFDVGTTYGMLEGMTLTSSDDSLELAWYSPDQLVQEVDPTQLSFATMEDFYIECCDEEHTFYMSVKNATMTDVNYELSISYVSN
jgi:hypothetical protein